MGLNSALAARKSAPIDAFAVSEALQASNSLLGEPDRDGEPGWLVSEWWWSRRLSAWRAVRRGGLKIAE
jgi:hypothetical protein